MAVKTQLLTGNPKSAVISFDVVKSGMEKINKFNGVEHLLAIKQCLDFIYCHIEDSYQILYIYHTFNVKCL